MIYKFKSKATGDLIMTQPVAERVLSLIGKPATPFLKFGDTVRIEITDGAGRSIFGAIEQTVTRQAPRG